MNNTNDLRLKIRRKEEILKQLGVHLTYDDLIRLNSVKSERELENLHSRLIRR